MSIYDRNFYQLNKDISNTQQLIDEYRYRPQLFDDDQVDELERRANELKIPFERKNNKTSLLKVGNKFVQGFERGLIPFIPPLSNKNRPQTTYESIAYSLGHLAGFAPGLLYLPLRGVTTAMRGASYVKGLARGAKPFPKKGIGKRGQSREIRESQAYQDFINEQIKISKFEKRGKQVVNFLDQMSIPMKVSRAAKRGLRDTQLKLRKNAIPYSDDAKKIQSILEEAVGLGAASTISNVWAGPDEYMNTFLGGALAGGAFGTIGNYVSIGNRLKFAKTPQQRDRAEKALRGLIGASFTGLPSTLRDEPIEEQLYQYLLGGFFGYTTRPAVEKEGGLVIMRMPTDKKSIILQPERLSEWSGLDKPVKDYIHKRSTVQAKEYLRRKPELIQNQTPEQNAIIRLGPALQKGENITQEKIDKVIRDTAHDAYNKSMDNTSGYESYNEPISDNLPDAKTDFMDSESFNTNTFTGIAGNIYKDLGKVQGNPNEIADKINNIFIDVVYNKDDLLDYQQDVPQLPLHKLKRAEAPNVEKFILSIKNEYNITPAHEKKLRQTFFSKAQTLPNETLAFNIVNPEGTITNIKPERIETQRKIIDLGMPFYNSPVESGYENVGIKGAIKRIDYLVVPNDLDPTGEGIIPKPISDIFAVDFEGNLIYPEALSNLQKQLVINNMYLRGGVKDKKTMTVARLTQDDIRLFDPPNSTEIGLLSTSNGFTGAEISKLKQQFKNAVAQTNNIAGFKDMDRYVERTIISNIRYEMSNNNYRTNPNTGLYNRTELKEVILGKQVGVDKNGQPIYEPNFLKNAVDFNKREQGSIESSGVPLHPDSFGKRTIKYAVVKDSALDYFGSNNPENIDGAEILSSKFQRQANTAIGREPKAKLKTNTVGNLVNAGGKVYHKTASFEASNVMNNLMERLGVDKIIVLSGNKIPGEHKVTDIKFNNETGEYDVLTEQPNIYEIKIENVRVNPSVRENVAKDTKGLNLPVQWGKTLDITFTPKTLANFADYYFEQPPIQKALEAKGDINKIKKDLEKDKNNLNKYSLEFILPKLQDPNPEYDFIRQAFQGIMKDEQSLLNEDFTNLGDSAYTFFHSRNRELVRLNNGMAGPLLVNQILKSEFSNAISKYVVMRAQNPFWESATKGFASPSEHGVIKEADFALKADREKYRDASNRLMLLDKDAGKVKVTIKNLNAEQIASLNKGIRGNKLKKLNQYGETNLATVHYLTKEYLDPSRIKTRDQKIVNEIQEARKLLAIRVPSDAVSGTRALIFAGFTNQSGLGFHVSNLDYRAMGGMDNDSDTAFLIFNPMPEHWTELNKPDVVNFVENINQKQRLQELGFQESTATGLDKFSLASRIAAYQNGQIGAANRGRAIALRDVLNELIFRARNNKEGNYYVANLEVIDPVLTNLTKSNIVQQKIVKLKIPVKEFEARKQEASEIIFTYINGMNDSTKYIKVPEYNFVKRKIYEKVFDGLNLDKDSNLPFDITTKLKRNEIDFIGEQLYRADQFQLIKKVSTEFKVKPFNQEAKTIQARKLLWDYVNIGMAGENYKWSGPIGKMLKNYKPNLLQGQLRGIAHPLKAGLEKALEPYKNDPDSQSFLEVFLKGGAGKVPIKEFPDTYEKLLEKVAKQKGKLTLADITYGLAGESLDRAFESDLEVTVNKIAAHQLLNKYAVEAFEALPERKKSNVIQFQNEINKLWNRARNILSAYHYTYGKISTNNNAPGRVDNVDIQIKIASQDILKFVKDNKLDKDAVRSLKLFFDTALLTPFKVRTFYKIDGVFWGSTEVSPLAKANFLKEINSIVQQAPVGRGVETDIEDIDIKIFTDTDIFKLPKATNINDMVENQKHLDTETTVDANNVVIKNIINKVKQPDKPKLADIKEPKVKSKKPKAKSIEERNAEQFAELQQQFTNDKDIIEINKFKDNLNKYNIADANDYFIQWTLQNLDQARDLSTVTMTDIKAVNNYFDNIMSKGLDAEVKGKYWAMNPESVGKEGMSLFLIPRIKKVIDVQTRKGVKKEQVVFYMDPLNAFLQKHRNAVILKNSIMNQTQEILKNELDYFDFMSIKEQQLLTKIISNRRNVEEKRIDLTLPEYNNFLTKVFSNKKGIKKTGEQWVDFYNNKFTELNDRISKGFIHAWNENKTELLDLKQILEVDLPSNVAQGKKTILYKGRVEFDKNGKFNFKLFEKGLSNNINKKTKGDVAYNLNMLLLYQYHLTLPKQNPKNVRPFSDSVEIGYVKPDEYYPRHSHGNTTEDKRLFDESILRQIQKDVGRDLDLDNPADVKIFNEQKLKYDLYREQSLQDNSGFEMDFLHSVYEDVGFFNKNGNLEKRGVFLDGYSKLPNFFERYINRIITTYVNNHVAILGNLEIQNFINNPNIEKYRKEYKKVDSVYKDNIEVWSDYLFIHLKNSLGHPSLFTHKVIASLDKSDPLKLKSGFGRLYYNTSDAFAVSELLKLRKKYIDKGTIDSKPILSQTKDMSEKEAALFIQRNLKDLSNLEARWQLMTILFNTGTAITNIFGAAINVIGQAGFSSYRQSFSNKAVQRKLLTDEFGNFVLKRKNGSIVTNRKDLIKKIREDGIIDAYMVQSEIDSNEAVGIGLRNAGVNIRDFTNDIVEAMKSDNHNTVLDVVKNYGVYESMTEAGAFFMSKSEQIARTNAFITFAIKAVDMQGNSGIRTNLADPFVMDVALKGIEATQFLYNNANRPAFMTSSLGKMFTRFKLFAFESVRVRQEFYRRAKYYGFKPGTESYEKFKNYFQMDLFVMMLAGAYMYSIFDTALSPPYTWFKETADWLFGDKKERDRAFYGTFPRPIAPLQELMPPMSRVPGAFVELLTGDWDKFADYTIWTLFPGGRMGYSIKKSINSKDWEKGAIENFTRLPIKKVQDSIELEKTLEDKKLLIDSLYEV